MSQGNAARKSIQEEGQEQRPQSRHQYGANLTRLNVLEDSQREIGVNDGAAASLELCVHYRDLAFT